MKELFGAQSKSKNTEKKKVFDWDRMDEKRLRAIEEFNIKFDNTLLQMGDESEQIMMNNSEFFSIVQDPKT